MRREIPLSITFIVGIFMILQYFVPHYTSEIAYETGLQWSIIVSSFALVLGIGSLLQHHTIKIKRKTLNWKYSIVALIGLVVMATAGLFFADTITYRDSVMTIGEGYNMELAYANGEIDKETLDIALRNQERETTKIIGFLKGTNRHLNEEDKKQLKDIWAIENLSLFANELKSNLENNRIETYAILNDATFSNIMQTYQGDSIFDKLFLYMMTPMEGTMFSLLAFFIASAAYRAFRIRSPEATILLIAAIIVMLGRVPIGYAINRHIPTIAAWILDVPNMAAKRAIMMGVGLGMASTSLKIILGIERSYLGGAE